MIQALLLLIAVGVFGLGLIVDQHVAWARRALANQQVINKNLAGAVLRQRGALASLQEETPIPLVVRATWSDDEKKTTRFSPVDNEPFRW